MSAEEHLREAKRLYRKSWEEFERAREKKDPDILRDACAKGWFSVIEATDAVFAKGGQRKVN